MIDLEKKIRAGVASCTIVVVEGNPGQPWRQTILGF